ncbi:hypothetical protein OUZ56_014779 [Daphnia magna]|uniref:Uncharacterized protein n=1 Tax=Daphnia magna TaxID=35525 RepID=A0ABR0AKV0_9CRUS|nr:hypothetical protein OUZ56_014779 [Daphnia magna]
MSVSSFCGTSRSHVTVESEIGHANPNTYAVPNGQHMRHLYRDKCTKSPRNGLNSAAMPPPPPNGAYGVQLAPKLVPVSSDGPRSSPSPPSW